MMATILGRSFGLVGANRSDRNRKARSLPLKPRIDGLERRELLTTGGSVSLAGNMAIVTPAPTGANTVIVSYQKVGGVTKLDVNLNNADNYFSTAQVRTVYMNGSTLSGDETFTNTTRVTGLAVGGSGVNTFTAGAFDDVFVGGSGNNTFKASTGYVVFYGGSGSNVFDTYAGGTMGGTIFKHSTADAVNGPTQNYSIFG